MRQAGFRGVLAVREFRALLAAELLSVAGDQLARVGLAVLVYQRTNSAGWTALTYALTFLPALLGGLVLSGLADRLPRRELMVGADLVRGVLALLMALPGLPISLLLALVFLLTLAGAPFKAAQQALLPSVLREQYLSGLSLRMVTGQSAQVAGFLGGGALLTFVDPHLALGLNAVTFVVSAIVIAVGVGYRPVPVRETRHEPGGTVRLIWRDRKLRALVALSWLVGVFAIPEGLAAPYAATLGVTTAAVGLLMAADPAGSIVGAWLVAKLPSGRRPALTTWLAVTAGVPLVLCLFQPPLGVVVLLWATSGACSTAYLILAQAAFVLGVPDDRRGAASGLVGAGVLSSQGVAVLAAGVLADATDPVLAVATGGVAGVVFTGLSGVSWLRARSRRQGRSPLRPGGREDDTDRDSELTSPCSSSEAPPPGEETDENDLVGTVTSPCSSSLAPPPAGTAAEHGNGGADQVIFAQSARPASLPTNERSRKPWHWALWDEPGRVLFLILLVETAMVALTALLAGHGVVDRHAFVTLGIIVFLGVTMGELSRHVERVRRRFNDTPHVNLTSVWTFSAALVLPPVLTPVLVGVLYVHLFWRSWYRVRGVRPYRLVFTGSTVVLASHTAFLIRHLYAPADVAAWGSPAVVLVVVLAVIGYSCVNSGLVGLAITLHDRHLDLRRALGTGKENALEYGTLGLGAITGLLIGIDPMWAVMIVPALLVLHRSVLMRQLEEAASTDQKTGLTNATAWTNLATAEVQRAARDGAQVGVLMVDLDHFKAVNDAHGHLVGDRVLQAVADVLSASVRRYDVVGRWGGEEFVVLCPEVTEDELRTIAERICEDVRQLRVPLDGATVDGLTVSIGIAVYPEFGPELQDVLLAADDALFVAKDSGRNQVQTIVAAIGDLGR
ncbi:diguanylate cyclase (GGDEF)-like protein [Actinophytocola oryzae]|uniref:Diguanylate cyclase (GGDEF)-like protein n=2 Tax=Actinophytocola oryzae TaxID=502181 RepID=A0A4R7UZW0_9PSEU|nr:diguanylate cyclase (GGDEF)-like protein [Actinophytocola oryzae]